MLPAHKSQSALEYMMTYGWAILIIVIVAAVLYSFGIFSPSSSISAAVTGFAGLGSVSVQCFPGGGLVLSLGNALGTPIEITRINTSSSSGKIVSQNFSTFISPGSSVYFTLTQACSNFSGLSFSNKVIIKYVIPSTQLPGPYISTGRVSGIVSSLGSVAYLKRIPPNNFYGDYHGSFIYVGNQSRFDFYNFTLIIWFNDASSNISGQGCDDFGLISKTTPGGDYESYLMDLGTACTSPGNFSLRSFVVNSSTDSEEWTTNSGVHYYAKPSTLYHIWHMMAFSYNINSGNESVYLDGNVVNTYKISGRLFNSIAPLIFGARAEVLPFNKSILGSRNFNGSLANVQIYNTTLTSHQIGLLFSEGLSGSPLFNTGLAGWWPLDGNTRDYSGNNDNGIPYNVTWVLP
ncbi:LamG domain-containing protein [Candidatus Parvarchaeota archaeon]|nr:LamG domain-containing protein [Candidatus Parvarchaeota archaeon]